MAILDGASDRPDGLQKTPLEAATTPNLDALVRRGTLSSMYTVGKGIAPESDAGVFSLLGYDPLQIHLSRGIVESIGAGVEFHDGDLALRAGFATVDGDKLVDRRSTGTSYGSQPRSPVEERNPVPPPGDRRTQGSSGLQSQLGQVLV